MYVVAFIVAILFFVGKAIYENVQISKSKYPDGRNKNCDDFWESIEYEEQLKMHLEQRTRELFPENYKDENK